MQRHLKLTLVVLTVLVLGSCQKHETYDVGGTGTVQPVLPDPVTANLQGNVLDENGLPAGGVTVTVGTQTASTDSRGYFRINAAALDKNQSLVTATKNGYFKAYRVFAASTATNQVLIKLVKRTLTGTVDASTGGEATLANGSKVSLPAGGIVDANSGASYTGAVKVFASYIDPSAQDIAQTVPGSFTADDKNGGRTLLTSYGMLAVELEGASGQKLQIKAGSSATLTTAIPAAAQASAPATVPLWYVDETTGIWKEQGVATKNGNSYVGNVSHFSFWNCDVANGNVITLSLTLLGPNGQAMPYARVRLSRANGMVTYTYTDSLGKASGYVPANEALTLAVIDNCQATVYNQNIGPFTANTNLPPLTIAASGQTSVISGRVVDCSNNGLANAIVLVNVGWQRYTYTTNASGNFSGNIMSCGNNPASIVAFDSSFQTQSNPLSVPNTAGAMQAGNIGVCALPANVEFFRMTVNGQSTFSYISTTQGDTLYSTLSNYVNNNTTGLQIAGWNMVGGDWRECDFYHNYPTNAPPTTGVAYPLYMVSIRQPGYTYDIAGQLADWYMVNGNATTVTYTSVASSVGQYWAGTFQGSCYQQGSSASQTVTVSGSFRVRRNQ